MHWAASSGAAEALLALAEDKEAFDGVCNLGSHEGDTPFLQACESGQLRCAQILASLGTKLF